MALDILLRHPERVHPIKLQSVAMRTLATLVEERRFLVDEVTGITNRLTITLKEYYPQVLDWFEQRNTMIFCDFLERWPTLKHVKRARKATLDSFFRQHKDTGHTSSRNASGAYAPRPLLRMIRPSSCHARCSCKHWSSNCASCCEL
jgi:hypothetical protein